MFKLRLQAQKCLCCGICQDVCAPRAIGMRMARGQSGEGAFLTYVLLEGPSNPEPRAPLMATFPYLRMPDACDGCGDCVEQCPAGALELSATMAGAAAGAG